MLIIVSFFSRIRFFWIYPILVLIFACRIVPGFLALHWKKENQEEPQLKVLSYNVGTFNLDRFHSSDTIRLSDSIIIARQQEFLKTCKADVICLQEFYNNDALSFSTTLNEMTDIGYKYFYTNPIRIEGYEGFFGVITFSKFPIADKGKITFEYKENKRALNTAIYTDIVVGKDTIRVINVHLHSMDLRAKRVLSSLPSDTLGKELDLFKAKMEYGFMKRGIQVQTLEKEVLKKPGHKILVGDLNDMPYSFSYLTIRKYLLNSFEEGGNGFGFTYNKFPWFIRIDNQFFSPSIEINSYEVLKENHLSDHYPVVAGYNVKK
ncbi:MAG TPA: endonuclease/exonuclease/phosphatase family protein [Cytophagaceae bacterium]|nr:endonuclease/exonuclease/phosphatase family protein [Cytophagaceae bacterium]